jgi:hypothetical protein
MRSDDILHGAPRPDNRPNVSSHITARLNNWHSYLKYLTPFKLMGRLERAARGGDKDALLRLALVTCGAILSPR